MSGTRTQVPLKSTLVRAETEKVAKQLATLRLTGSPAPLRLGKSLDSFKRVDATPTIGTELLGIDLRQLSDSQKDELCVPPPLQ